MVIYLKQKTLHLKNSDNLRLILGWKESPMTFEDGKEINVTLGFTVYI